MILRSRISWNKTNYLDEITLPIENFTERNELCDKVDLEARLVRAKNRAAVGNAPTKENELEPEFFLEAGMLADPRLEIAVRGLPILPIEARGVNGAGSGAEIIVVKRFRNVGESGRVGGLKISKDEFGILSKIELGVKRKLACDFGTIKFVETRIKTAIASE